MNARTKHPRAFTLIEVMISIFLVLLLIMGINQAFKITSSTVGAGQALSTKVRDSIAAQSVFQQEIGRAIVTASEDMPFLIIDSRTQPAFLNRQEEQTDRDYTANTAPTAPPGAIGGGPYAANYLAHWKKILTVDLNDDNNEDINPANGEVVGAATYNERNHRVDTLAFFARDLYRRQTGNDAANNLTGTVAPASYAADQSSNEALVVYGHSWLPRTGGASPIWYVDPAANPLLRTWPGWSNAAGNPLNFYAADWVLGRNAILLVAPTANTTPPPAPLDATGRALVAIDTAPNAGTGVVTSRVSVNAYASHDTYNAPTGNADNQRWIQCSRYDAAVTTMKTVRDDIQNYINANPTSPYKYDWWINFSYRFQCNPALGTTITPKAAAQTAPYFVGHCSQFIVEYAGNFVAQFNDPTQNNFGDVITTAGEAVYTDASFKDTEIDFCVDTLPGNQKVKRIRWYGMPRDVAGSPTGGPDGKIPGYNAGRTARDMPDVLPLRDIYRTAPGHTIDIFSNQLGHAPFERIFNAAGTQLFPPRDDYAKLANQESPPGQNPNAPMNSFDRYVCAWGPDAATTGLKMIRILMTVEDPNGRLAAGQTFEYVIKLP